MSVFVTSLFLDDACGTVGMAPLCAFVSDLWTLPLGVLAWPGALTVLICDVTHLDVGEVFLA